MAEKNEGEIVHESDHGISAQHPDDEKVLLVEPSMAPGGTPSNMTLPIRLIACWKAEDICFDFDSSFVKPDSNDEIQAFFKLWNDNDKPPISIFGHADPVGEDVYNKTLSENRAKAIYGIIVKDPNIWLEIFKKPAEKKALLEKLISLTKKDGKKIVEKDPGPTFDVNNNINEETLRSALNQYFDYHIGDNKPLTESNFLGGKIAAYQGCSEFNPLIMFSKEEWNNYKKPSQKDDRNKANEPNRRVIIFLFHPDTQITDQIWPCPKAPNINKCKVWDKNGKKNREFQAGRHREHNVTKDTFACSFYRKIAQISPCEKVREIKKAPPEVKLLFEEESKINFHKYYKTIQVEVKIPEGGSYRTEYRTFMEWVEESGRVVSFPDKHFGFPKSLEKMEINNGGKVVEKNATHRVESLMRTENDKGDTLYIFKVSIIEEETENILFEAEIQAKSLFDRGGLWIRSGGTRNRMVWRRPVGDKKSKFFIDGEELTFEELEKKDLPSEPGINEKLEELYNKLKGNYDNITKRVVAELEQNP